MTNTNETREKLALAVVDSWDLNTLIGAMVERLEADYKHSSLVFDEDWFNMFEEGEAA